MKAIKESEIEPRILSRPQSSRRKWTIGIIIIVLIVSNVLYLTCALTFAILYFRPKPTVNSPDDVPEMPVSDSFLGRYSTAAVASDNDICSNIGRNILFSGRNAVDAAIATLFCIGVTDPQSSGLGGGLFMTIFNGTTKKCYAIDAREVAPSTATENMFADESRWNKSKYGWEAVAIPGELHGLWTAYKKFGGGRWASLLQPSINLLQNGFPTSHSLANALREKEEQIMANPSLKDIFVNPNTKKLFKLGEIIETRKKLAETLQTLSDNYVYSPVKIFYDAEMTGNMLKEFHKNGVNISMTDFSNYKAILREETSGLLSTRLGNGWTVCGPPPPSSAAIVHGILNILDPISFKTNSSSGILDFLHFFVEASKFAYADRSLMSDMIFVPNAFKLAEKMTTREWAQKARSKITWGPHPEEYYIENPKARSTSLPHDHGTAHVSVIDKWGNAVSATSSINLHFGSLMVSESTGIIWNNQMDDFSTPNRSNYWHYPPSPTNFIRPGKRPMSSMSPIVIYNRDIEKKEVLALGAAGGSTIISGVAGAAFRTLRLGENIKQAIDFPRLHNQLQPNFILYEKSMPEKYMKELVKRGHQTKPCQWMTVVIGAHASNGTIFANSDWRKGSESQPAGY